MFRCWWTQSCLWCSHHYAYSCSTLPLFCASKHLEMTVHVHLEKKKLWKIIKFQDSGNCSIVPQISIVCSILGGGIFLHSSCPSVLDWVLSFLSWLFFDEHLITKSVAACGALVKLFLLAFWVDVSQVFLCFVSPPACICTAWACLGLWTRIFLFFLHLGLLWPLRAGIVFGCLCFIIVYYFLGLLLSGGWVLCSPPVLGFLFLWSWGRFVRLQPAASILAKNEMAGF